MNLIREIHKRLAWQALVLYLVVAAGMLILVQELADVLGMPGWVPVFAGALLFLGAPVVLLTAFVEGGVPFFRRTPYRDEVDPRLLEGRTPEEVQRFLPARIFTWRNAILAAVCASVMFVSSLVAYVGMWAAGVGSMGSLVAQGLMAVDETVVVTAFQEEGSTGRGEAVTAGLVEGLSGSRVFRVADASRLPVDFARAEAVFRGAGLVLVGEVVPRRSGYLIRAHLTEAGSARSVASFRVFAREPEDLPAAVQTLSRRIRMKSGEAPGGIGNDGTP